MTPRIPYNPYGHPGKGWGRQASKNQQTHVPGAVSHFKKNPKYPRMFGHPGAPGSPYRQSVAMYKPRHFGAPLRPIALGKGSMGRSGTVAKYRFAMSAGPTQPGSRSNTRRNVAIGGGILVLGAAAGYAAHRHYKAKRLKTAVKAQHSRKPIRVKRGAKGRFAGSY